MEVLGLPGMMILRMGTRVPNMETLSQDIANDLVALAHYVRTEPQGARDYIDASEAITAKLRNLYDIVGEP